MPATAPTSDCAALHTTGLNTTASRVALRTPTLVSPKCWASCHSAQPTKPPRFPPSEPPSNAGATGAFGEDCLSATADGGAGAPLAGMRPGSGMPAHRHDCGRMRAYTVASPMGPLLRAPVRACFMRGRVPQPPVASSNAGHPEGAVQLGGLLWLTFLDRARKVSSCRATPGQLVSEMCNNRGQTTFF